MHFEATCQDEIQLVFAKSLINKIQLLLHFYLNLMLLKAIGLTG